MKLKTIRQSILTLAILFMGISCNDYLKEEAISDITSDSYYTTETGFEDLIKSCYPLLRDVIEQRELVLLGTDIFTRTGWDEGEQGTSSGDPFNLYDVRLNSSMGELANLWDLLYRMVARANTAVTRSSDVEGMAPDLLNVRVSEAKFLRAFAYFHLVQQWGAIPMPLEETTSASRTIERIPASEVYSQIIADLTEAEAALPETASDYGRVTKGAARFLLARVYLTRGWNYNNSLGGSSADFDKALEYADQIIASYPLAPNYSDLFPAHAENPLLETFPAQNDQNPEIVFAVQYSDDVLTYGGDVTNPDANEGNSYHSVFGGGVEAMPGQLGRSSDYNRHLNRFIVTPAMYRLFDPDNDTRYHFNFVDAIIALNDVPVFNPTPETTISISKGDTVVAYRPWNAPAEGDELGMDRGGSKPYAVINTDEFGTVEDSPYHTEDTHPLMWKFWEPGIPYGDAYGTFDFALFRSAEAYLIAAEAIVKGASGGNLGGAHVYYNAVLDRALGNNGVSEPLCADEPSDVSSLDTKSYRATAENISVDMILDERARELMGEFNRWYDLKRTGKLIERTYQNNPWTKIKGELTDYHLLRPIPQHEIDRSSPPIQNNDGYN